MVDLCFVRNSSDEQGVKYERMRKEYEETGLNHTILHMLHTFHLSLTPSSISWEQLIDVLKCLFLNEMELALLVFLYKKVGGRNWPDLYSLLLLCGLHAKMYLNNNVQPIKKVLESRIPGFHKAFREFTDRYCGLEVPPIELNKTFLELRRVTHQEADKIIDKNYQIELLDPVPDPQKMTLREADDQFSDTPCFLGYQYLAFDMMVNRTKAVQADEETYGEEQKEPIEPDSSRERDRPAVQSPVEDPIQPLDLGRQTSIQSQQSDDTFLKRERSLFSETLPFRP